MKSQPPSSIEIPEVEERHPGADVELPHSPDETAEGEVKELGESVSSESSQAQEDGGLPAQTSSEEQSAVVETVEDTEVEGQLEEQAGNQTQVVETFPASDPPRLEENAVKGGAEEETRVEDEEKKAEEPNEPSQSREQEIPVTDASTPSESDVEVLRQRLKLVEQRFSGLSTSQLDD